MFRSQKSTLIELCTKSDESIAQELYNNLYKEHNNFSFKKSGLVISDDYPFLGASPDGIACCDCCGRDKISIQSQRKVSGRYLLRERVSFRDEDGQVSCRSLSPWYTQMQVQMYVTKSTLCHLAIYTQVPPFLHVIKLHSMKNGVNHKYLSSTKPLRNSFGLCWVIEYFVNMKLKCVYGL